MADDDDFGDFGGFEAAEPVAPKEAEPIPAGVQASPSPWAVLPENIPEAGSEVTPSPVDGDTASPTTENKSSEEKEDFQNFAQFPPTDGSGDTTEAAVKASKENEEQLQDQVKTLEEKVSVVEKEKSQVQKEFDKLLEDHKEAQKELESAKDRLEEQNQICNDLQEKHKKELEDLRQAGHDAIAMVVEEYKEQFKVSLLHQEELSKESMKMVLEEQSEKYDKLIKEQELHLENRLEEERKLMQEKFDKTLDLQIDSQKESLEKAIQEQQEKQEAALKKAVQEEKNSSKKCIEDAVQEERKKALALLEEEREKFQKLLEEERSKGATEIQNAVQQECELSKDMLKSTLADEQLKHSKSLQEVKDKLLSENKTALEALRKEDHVMRRRQYMTMDLFLESCKKQLQMLMEDNSEGLSTSQDKSKE